MDRAGSSHGRWRKRAAPMPYSSIAMKRANGPGTMKRARNSHWENKVCMPRSAAGMCPIDRRSEEHTSELQSLMRISYAVFCLKTQNIITIHPRKHTQVIHQTLRHHLIH